MREKDEKKKPVMQTQSAAASTLHSLISQNSSTPASFSLKQLK